MKLITHKNYFQRKHWRQAALHKQVRDEEAKMTDEERTASKQRQAESLNRLKEKLNEHMASSHYEPLHFRRGCSALHLRRLCRSQRTIPWMYMLNKVRRMLEFVSLPISSYPKQNGWTASKNDACCG